jgi:cytochrome P450
LDSKLPPEKKTSAQLGQEFHEVISTGTETTAHMLTIITYHLLENPDKLQRLQAEIQQLEPNSSAELRIQKLEQLLYLVF